MTLTGVELQTRKYQAASEHRDRVAAAADAIMDRHADALRRLGE